MQPVNVEERVQQINKELSDFQDRLNRAETVYNDETRMRQIVESIVEPIILIAKQNALTNCFKNDELQSAREEVRDLSEKIIQFRKQLDQLHEYDNKLFRMEERFIDQLNKANRNFEPTRKLSKEVKDEVSEVRIKVREIRQSLNQREQRLIDLENLFIEHQKTTKEDILSKVQRNIDIIEEMHPKIQQMTNVSAQCEEYFNQSKEELSSMHQRIQENQTRTNSLENELENIKMSKIKDMEISISSNSNQVQEIMRQLTNSNIRMTQIEEAFTNFNKNLTDLNHFAIFQQPALTQMQISDVLQEFLCIPDQLKLIQFDNEKLNQFKQFRDDQSSFLGTNKLPGILKFQDLIQQIEEEIKETKNGCTRINFAKDFLFEKSSQRQRINQISNDLIAKGELIKKIYLFEKQMFLAQGRITGQIASTQDLVDEKIMSGSNQSDSKEDKLINLQDPNHRLKQFIQYQNHRTLNTLNGLSNQMVRKQQSEEKLQKNQTRTIDAGSSVPISGIRSSIQDNGDQPQKKVVTQKTGTMSSNSGVVGPEATQGSAEKYKSDVRSKEFNDSQQQKMNMNELAVPNETMRSSQKIREDISNRLANAELTGHPDFGMLPEENCCSRCGFRNRRFGNAKNNNHMQGSGMQNVIYEIVFIRSQTKIDRLHHRFLGKKRAWLTRQIDPQKKYLHALNKQARMDLQNQDLLDSVNDDLEDGLDFEDDYEDENNNQDMVIDDGEEYQDQEDRDDQIITPQNLEAKSQFIDIVNESHSKKNLNNFKSLKQGSNINQQQIKTPKIEIQEVSSTNFDATLKNSMISKQKTVIGQKKGREHSATIKKKKMDGFTGAHKDPSGSLASSSKQFDPSMKSKLSNKDSGGFDQGEADRKRFMKVRGLEKTGADARSKFCQESSGGRSLVETQRRQGHQIDAKKIQALIQSQIIKMKQQVDASVMTSISALQSSMTSKFGAINSKIEVIQKQSQDQKLMIDQAMSKSFEILEKRMHKLEHNQDYLDQLYKENASKCESFITNQTSKLDEFKNYVCHEYVDFFKNRKRVKMEIMEHSKEYRNRYKVLSALNDHFSFKFNYIDSVIPIISEQCRLTYNILLQDIQIREGLARTLSESPNPAHNGYLILEQARNQQHINQGGVFNSAKLDQLSQDILNLQVQVQKLQNNQNLKLDLDTTNTSLGGQGPLDVIAMRTAASATQMTTYSPGGERRHYITVNDEKDLTQPETLSPYVEKRRELKSIASKTILSQLDKRNASGPVAHPLRDMQGNPLSKSKQVLNNYQFISPHQELLPDEYFKKRLHNQSNSGLHLQSIVYRQQKIDLHSIFLYLDMMQEKLDILMQQVVPLGSSWSPGMQKETTPENMMPTKILFDDIHFGKDILVNAHKIDQLDIENIYKKFIKLDIQDQNFPQDYLNYYMNECVAVRSGEKITIQPTSFQASNCNNKFYNTQSPQTIKNEAFKSDQCVKELEKEVSVCGELINSQQERGLLNKRLSGKRDDRIKNNVKPQRSQSSHPKVIDQPSNQNSKIGYISKTNGEYGKQSVSAKEKKGSITVGDGPGIQSAPGTVINRQPAAPSTSKAQPSMPFHHKSSLPMKNTLNTGTMTVSQRLGQQGPNFYMTTMTGGISALNDLNHSSSNINRKTNIILSQDNQRSKQVNEGLNKLPIKMTQNQLYQGKALQHKLNALNSRNHGSFSAENFRNMNYTMPISETGSAIMAARYDSNKIGQAVDYNLHNQYSNLPSKTLINKVSDASALKIQQTPLDSSTSTEMRYLSAKQPTAVNNIVANTGNLLNKGAMVQHSRNFPHTATKSQKSATDKSDQQSGNLKVQIQPESKMGQQVGWARGGRD